MTNASYSNSHLHKADIQLTVRLQTKGLTYNRSIYLLIQILRTGISMWKITILLFYLVSVIISVVIAMLIDKAVQRYLNIKVKAPVFITIIVLFMLWSLLSLAIDGVGP